MPADLTAEVKKVVCRVLEVEHHELDGATPFKDLGADSMRIVELMANLEIEFDIDLDNDQFDRLIDLDGAVAIIAEALTT